MASPSIINGLDGKAAEVSIGPDLNASRGTLDKKFYRQIALPNGLRALLVEDTLARSSSSSAILSHDDSDEDYDSTSSVSSTPTLTSSREYDSGLRDAAACVLVGAGSAYDPSSCQGLAHFLEHLLFMGSAKYPGENEYESYISKHGGSDNAYTEWEYTVYSLDIPQDALWGALDRLAQFFIAPLLSESAVDRELLAIESEFQLQTHSNSTRWHQLLSSTAQRDHFMASFAWGNLRSLRQIPALRQVNPLAELRNFFDQYYYAANMRLVIVGAYPLDVMTEKVLELFGPIPPLPRSQPQQQLPVDPLTLMSWTASYQSPLGDMGSPMHQDLGKIFRIVSVKEAHLLKLTWPLPPLTEHWASKPTDYIAHLMGHEAEGSLLSYLRQKSWATTCVADSDERYSSHSLFSLEFELSEQGLQHWKEVVEATYQYIGLLRLQSWPGYIFEELQRTEELSYRYDDEMSPDELAEHFVEHMAPHLNLPSERLLDGFSLLFEFDAVTVQRFLDQMTPRNARIDITSSAFGRLTDYKEGIARDGVSTLLEDMRVDDEPEAFDTKALEPLAEPMFGTLFWCSVVPDVWLDEWTRLAEPQTPTLPLHLPPKNPFVPIDLELKELPPDDAHHPLMHCSLKLCVAVGKKKQWFPATVTQYDSKKKQLLLSYEDQNEQWHTLDDEMAEVRVDAQGTFDQSSVKFRVLATSGPGQSAVPRFGDESDWDVEDGKTFPLIPPAAPPSRLPREIWNTNVLKFWWLQDRHFHRPIADLRLQIVCAHANETALHRTCAELLTLLCEDALVESSYLASVCELTYSIETTDQGFLLKVSGFSDKLLVLFETVTSVFFSFARQDDRLPDSVPVERFAACREVLEQKYKNTGTKAASLCSNLRLRAVRPTIWSTRFKLAALGELDIGQFAKMAASLFDGYAVEGLYHGNADRSDADRVKDLILKLTEPAGNVGLSRKKYPPQSVLRIPTVATTLRITAPSKDPAEPNTCVEVYIQVGKDNLRERVLIDLLVHLMAEPFFDQVRTKDQFGYDVGCDVRWTYGIMGFIFHVVTNVKSAEDVVERVDRFLTEYRQVLLDCDDFLEQLIGLAKQKLDMFNSLSEETDSYWDEIRDGRFEWQSWRDEAVSLRSVTKEHVLEAFDKWLNPSMPRNIVAVQVIGTGQERASSGRPDVSADDLWSFVDEQVESFHKLCKQQTWGRVNSKLF